MVLAGGTDWMLLDPAEHPEFDHPAFQDMASGAVLDNTPGAQVGDWMLLPHSEAFHDDEHGHVGVEMQLYNTVTLETITTEDVEAGGTDWMLVDSVQFPDLEHPAFFDTTTSLILDSTPGAQLGDWILTASDEDEHAEHEHDNHEDHESEGGHEDHEDDADHDYADEACLLYTSDAADD